MSKKQEFGFKRVIHRAYYYRITATDEVEAWKRIESALDDLDAALEMYRDNASFSETYSEALSDEDSRIHEVDVQEIRDEMGLDAPIGEENDE